VTNVVVPPRLTDLVLLAVPAPTGDDWVQIEIAAVSTPPTATR